MPPTNVITTGDTAENSGDIVLAAGETANVCLKGTTGSADAGIERKDDTGAWVWAGTLSKLDPSRILLGPGTYRITRRAGMTFGVFRD